MRHYRWHWTDLEVKMTDADALDESSAQGPLPGAAIRRLRRARGLTLVELASAAGLSHPFLSQVERGRATPSMRSLASIAHALGTSQIELLTAPDAADASPVSVIPAGHAARGIYGDGRASLLVTRSDARFSPIVVRGTQQDYGERFAHDEHEFLHLIAGHMEIELDGDCQLLVPGDSVYYGARVPHRWRAVDPEGYHAIVVKERPRLEGGGV